MMPTEAETSLSCALLGIGIPQELGGMMMAGETTPTKRRWLLFVAVARYAAGDRILQPLPGVIADLNRLNDLIRHFGHLPLARTICLYNHEATRAAILDAFAIVAREALESDQVVVYFGGHGCQKLGGDSPMPDGMTRYLLPYEAAPDTAAESGISTRALADALSNLHASEIVVILDCCHAGGLADVFWQDLEGLRQGRRSRYLIASSQSFQQAVDTDTGSPLTQNFCDGLQGKVPVQTSAEGLVSASAAYEHAEERMRQETAHIGHHQMPKFSGFGNTIYLTRPPTPPAFDTANNHHRGGPVDVLDMLSEQMRAWFEALGYTFEGHPVRGEASFEWIVNVPKRRGYDRVLVKGIAGQGSVADVVQLRESVEHHRTHEGWLVGTALIGPAARTEVQPSENLYCYTFDELVEEQADFTSYVEWLKGEVKRQRIDELYIPLACTKPEFHPVTGDKMAEARYDQRHGWIEGYIDGWLDYPGREHVSILGEFGTGKTWFTLRYAWTALHRYLDAKQRGLARPRLPLVIPLRDYAKAVSVEGVFSEFFFRKHEIRLPGYRAFDQLNRMGRLLLIFDGFDEMAVRVDRQKMIDNFRALAEVVVPGSKAILTCRAEHFADINQAIEVLNQGPVRFDLLELEHFNRDQVQQALVLRDVHDDVIKQIMDNEDLLGFARRPIMIDIILEALPDIRADKPVDLSRVYLYALRRIMERGIEEKRTFTSEADKFYFFSELSWEMLSANQMSLNFRDFPDRVRQNFGVEVQQKKDLDHWEHDLRRNGILIRNEEGDYVPAHRSLLEFFAAYKFVANLGIMDSDFVEPSRYQSHVDNQTTPKAYIWADYFQPAIDESGQRQRIAPLDTFAGEALERIEGMSVFHGNSNDLVFAAGMVSSEPECLSKLVKMALDEGGKIAWTAQSFIPYLKHQDHAEPLARGIVEASHGGPLPYGVPWVLGELGVPIPAVLKALKDTIDYFAHGEGASESWWQSAFALEKLGQFAAKQEWRGRGDGPISLLTDNLPKNREVDVLMQKLRGHLEARSAENFRIEYPDVVLIVRHESDADVQELFQNSLALIDFSSDTKWKRCYRLTWLCGHLGAGVPFQKECLRCLLAATKNPLGAVRNCATEGLGKMGVASSDVIEAVEKSLGDGYYRTRYHAAWSLGQLKSVASIPKISAQLKVEQVLDVQKELMRVRERLQRL